MANANTNDNEKQNQQPQQAVTKEKPMPTVEFNHPLIDQHLVGLITRETTAIRETLVDKGNANQKLGEQLMLLQMRFEVIALDREFSKEDAVNAFEEFVAIEFGLKESRTKELIRVALHMGGFNLTLEISKIVELSRLEKPQIEALLKDYPQEKLAAMPCKAVANLTRRYNKKKRDRSKISTPKVGADNKVDTNNNIATPPLENADKAANNVAPLFSSDKIKNSTEQDKAILALRSAVNMVLKAFDKTENLGQDLTVEVDRLNNWKIAKRTKKAAGV